LGEDVDLLPPLQPGFYRIDATRLEDTNDEMTGQALPPLILTVREWESLEYAAARMVGLNEQIQQ
jgi:hypothetical protein